MSPFSPNNGCPCINASTILSSLDTRSCLTSSYEKGVLLTPERSSCVPIDYGSNACDKHDRLHNPVCRGDLDEADTWCLRKWCYVDLDSCMTNSSKRVYRSDYFGSSTKLLLGNATGVDLFYSYEACGSSGDDWGVFKEKNMRTYKAFGGVHITASAARASYPMVFKEGARTDPEAREYLDDTIPYEGVYIDYFNKLIEFSEGDILSVKYKHESNSAIARYPPSTATAACQDVADGITDMAVGPYWITPERLSMTMFTVPLLYDQTVLVVRKQETGFRADVAKVFEPFKWGVWLAIALIILITALLSLWFSDRESLARTTAAGPSIEELKSNHQRHRAYARLILDSILEKGLFFFGSAASHNEGASISYNLLMFGFGFFIMIVAGAYVANLAAFLTSKNVYVTTMEGVEKEGKTICAHGELKRELKAKWPNINFKFHEEGKDFHGVLDDFNASKCDLMAVGKEDTTLDRELMQKFCDLGLIYTDSLVIEVPIGFPIKAEIASGLSYWIRQASINGSDLSFEAFKNPYKKERDLHLSCKPDELSSQEMQHLGDTEPITVRNITGPLLFFSMFALAAVMLKVLRHRRVFRTSTYGRVLSQVRSLTKSIYDDTAIPITEEGLDNSKIDDGCNKEMRRDSDLWIDNAKSVRDEEGSTSAASF